MIRSARQTGERLSIPINASVVPGTEPHEAICKPIDSASLSGTSASGGPWAYVAPPPFSAWGDDDMSCVQLQLARAPVGVYLYLSTPGCPVSFVSRFHPDLSPILSSSISSQHSSAGGIPNCPASTTLSVVGGQRPHHVRFRGRPHLVSIAVLRHSKRHFDR